MCLAKKYPNYPIVKQYRYLGVEIYRSGSIKHYLDRIKARANYLTSCMRYYAKDLSFQNQYLLWTCYVKPYFTYVASIINYPASRPDRDVQPGMAEVNQAAPGLALIDPIRIPIPIIR